MKKASYIFVLLLLKVSTLFSQTPGTLDSSFGTNGIVSGDIPLKSADGMAIQNIIRQNDGKFIGLLDKSFRDTSGNYLDSFFVMRFLPGGQVDLGFGNSGIVYISNQYQQVFLTTNENLLLISSEDGEIKLTRLLKEGLIDNHFGTNGVMYTGLFIYPSGVEVLPNGKILLCGTNPSGNSTVLARLNEDGYRDEAFGPDGIRIYHFDSNEDGESVRKIKILRNGNILIAGSAYMNNGNYPTLTCLKSNGDYDITFSSDGKQQMFLKDLYIADIEMLNDDKFVVGGFYYYSNYSKIGLAIAQLKSNGIPDSTFGINGIRMTSFGGASDLLTNLIIQEDGKIIGSGSSDSKFALIRLNTNGNLDLPFNGTGKNVTSVAGSLYGSPSDLELGPDGKILLAGYAYYPDETVKFIQARYHTGYHVGMNENNDIIQQMMVYPNPTHTRSILEYNLKIPAQVSIAIYDMQGKLVRNINHPEKLSAGIHREELTTDDLPQGIYAVTIQHETGKRQFRLIKE